MGGKGKRGGGEEEWNGKINVKNSKIKKVKKCCDRKERKGN